MPGVPLRSQQPLVLCLIHDIQHNYNLLAPYSNYWQGIVSLILTQRKGQDPDYYGPETEAIQAEWEGGTGLEPVTPCV